MKEVREDDESIESAGAVEEKTQEETTNRGANEDDASVTGSVCVSNEALQSQPVEAMCTLEVLVKHTRERVGENTARHSVRSVNLVREGVSDTSIEKVCGATQKNNNNIVCGTRNFRDTSKGERRPNPLSVTAFL